MCDNLKVLLLRAVRIRFTSFGKLFVGLNKLHKDGTEGLIHTSKKWLCEERK